MGRETRFLRVLRLETRDLGRNRVSEVSVRSRIKLANQTAIK